MDDLRRPFAQMGLYRSQDDRILAGVCAGLGRRLGIDPWPARLLFLILLLVVPGSQFLVYPVLWLLMPQAEVHGAGGTWGPPPTTHP